MNEDEKSFRLKYVGSRFEGVRLSVDVLSDLPAFRDLLQAYAKDEWRSINPDRQRVPKGFDKSIALDLVAIEPGSAVPKLNWNRQAAQDNLPGFSDELKEIVSRSFNDIVSLIDNAGNNVFPKSLSSEHIRALNKLGSGLRDEERIEFEGTEGRDGKVVFLDNYRRKALITKVRETYQSRYDGIGRLLGSFVPSEARLYGHIVVATNDYGSINIPLDPEQVREDFDGNIDSDVQFDLQIELDNDNRLRAVISVFDVSVIDAQIVPDLQRCRARLSEIQSLNPGWHDGAGVRIQTDAVTAADRFLVKRPGLLKHYRIFPTEEGGVMFEFEHSGWDLSVEFGPNGSAEFYGVQLDGAEELEPLVYPSVNDEFMAVFDKFTQLRT